MIWNFSLDGVRSPSRNPTPRKLDDLPPRGAQCLPGDYSITVKHGDREATTSATVLPDPREDISSADRLAKHRAVMQGQRLVGELAALTDRLARAKKDVTAIKDRLNASATPEERDEWSKAKSTDQESEESEESETSEHADNTETTDEPEEQASAADSTSHEDPRTALHLAVKHAIKEIQTLQDDIFGKENMQGIVRRRSALDTTRGAAYSLRSSNDLPTSAQLTRLERAITEVTGFRDRLSALISDSVANVSARLRESSLSLAPSLDGVPTSESSGR